jgi:uncharacterized membrane protein YfcA
MEFNNFLLLCLGFFVVATLYSSVGFGGGSSYLALLALFLTEFYAIRSIALLCNLVVVSGGCYLFYKKELFEIKKFLPFVVTSIPLSFLGASFRLKENVFFIILGITLIVSSVALIVQTLRNQHKTETHQKYPTVVNYILGGFIGFLAGLVGIGGGIFLAPILNHLRWEKSLTIAALTSFFILVNSISGLSGLILNDTFQVPVTYAIGLMFVVLLGGQLGTRITLRKLSGNSIKRLTALLVFSVGIRVLLVNGLQINF